MSPSLRALRNGAPIAVSVGIFAWLLARDDIDVAGVLGSLDPAALAGLVVAVLAYGAVSVAIEALSLVRAIGQPLSWPLLVLAGRIKAASYLAYTVHYSIGVGALSILLRRRMGLGLAQATGVVLLVAAFDLAFTLAAAMLGLGMLETETQSLRAGVVVAASSMLVAGFLLLRTRVSLGPLDRLRDLELFRAAREAPGRVVLEILVLRGVFVGCFFTVAGAALYIFGIQPSLPVLLVNVSILALVVALPIAVAGLGTGQAAFVYLFRDFGEPDALLGCSLALSAGLITLRAGMGLAFAREWAREAIQAARQEEAQA